MLSGWPGSGPLRPAGGLSWCRVNRCYGVIRQWLLAIDAELFTWLYK